MKKIQLVLILLINFIASYVFAQSDPFLRVEIETKSDAAAFQIIPGGEQGLVFFYETTIKEDNYKFWVFVLYNKFMQENWKKDIPVFDNLSYKLHAQNGNFLYLLFHDAEKKKSETYNYQIMKLNLINGSYELFSGVIPNNSQVTAIEVIGNYVFAGINTNEGNAAIYSLSFGSRETKEVTNYAIGSSRFEGFYLDTLNKSMFAIFNIFISKTEQYLLVNQYDTQGKIIKSIKARSELGKKFNSAKITTTGKGAWLLIGTYDFTTGSSIQAKNYFKDQSSGYFTTIITSNGQGKTEYNNFLDLENMTGYLKTKEFETAKKKADNSKKGKDKYAIDFNLLLHEIIKKDSLYYFISEGYYEEYHTVTNTYYDYYGHPSPVSYTVFDGYKYFNAFVSCYDETGNKLWDNGMEIFNILTMNLNNRIVVYFDNDEMVLAFNHEGKIGAKIIKGTEVVEGLDYFPIEPTYNNDKVMEDTKSNMAFWYDNYFLAYGFQTIRNNTLVRNNKRTVFYINKVGFH